MCIVLPLHTTEVFYHLLYNQNHSTKECRAQREDPQGLVFYTNDLGWGTTNLSKQVRCLTFTRFFILGGLIYHVNYRMVDFNRIKFFVLPTTT